MIKVLQICNKPPLPKVDGGCVAISNICEGLMNEKEIDLKILTVETEKHPFIKENYPNKYLKKGKIESVFIDTRVNFVDAFSSYITSDSYNVIRFFSPTFDKKLREILEESTFDIVHIESLFITPYLHTIRKFSTAKILLRAHNIEHALWEGKEKFTRNFFKKVYLNFLHKQLKKYETNVLKDVDGIISISPNDDEIIHNICQKPSVIIPLGISPIKTTQNKRTEGVIKLFHIGAMDWIHNTEGINWFIDTIWPKVHKLYPQLELHLAGKNISPDYHIPHQNIFCHGEVEDAQKFILKHDVLITPLKTASGLRIKIIEAFNLGKTVISTSIGMAGINAIENEHYFVANTTEGFINAIEKLDKNPDLIDEMGANSKLFIEKNYSNASVMNSLVEFYKIMLK